MITKVLTFLAFSGSVYAKKDTSTSKESSSILQLAATALLSIGIIYTLFKNRQSTPSSVLTTHEVTKIEKTPSVESANASTPISAPRKGVPIDLSEPGDKKDPSKTNLGANLRAVGHTAIEGSADASGVAAAAGFGAAVPAAILLAPVMGSVIQKAVKKGGNIAVDAAVDYSQEKFNSFN